MICPHCHHPKTIALKAKTPKFATQWQFFGEAGKRWIVCQSDTHKHFKVSIGGFIQHRLWTCGEVGQGAVKAQKEKRKNVRRKALPDWLR